MVLKNGMFLKIFYNAACWVIIISTVKQHIAPSVADNNFIKLGRYPICKNGHSCTEQRLVVMIFNYQISKLTATRVYKMSSFYIHINGIILLPYATLTVLFHQICAAMEQ